MFFKQNIYLIYTAMLYQLANLGFENNNQDSIKESKKQYTEIIKYIDNAGNVKTTCHKRSYYEPVTTETKTTGRIEENYFWETTITDKMSKLMIKEWCIRLLIVTCSAGGYFIYNHCKKKQEIEKAQLIIKKLWHECQKNIQQEIRAFLALHPETLELYKELTLNKTMIYDEKDIEIQENFEQLVNIVRKIIIIEASKYKQHKLNKKIDNIKIWNRIFYNKDNYHLLNSIIRELLSNNEKLMEYVL